MDEAKVVFNGLMKEGCHVCTKSLSKNSLKLSTTFTTTSEKHLSAPQLVFHSPETAESRLHTTDECWSEESEADFGASAPFCRWWNRQQSRVKSFTDHRYFQRGILTAILVNTLSMGIEYHNQPDELTLAVEISNVIFTAVFFLEMILKMFAEGFCSYISSGFNVFDSVIVVLSLVELCQSSGGGGSGLSVLRTFRLLRILKLVRFLPALRRQLIIMLRTVDNVAVFFALLILFIFIFSILGMNLFGCKFCRKLPEGATQCDRKNFDSLLWAIVTVFQILTQEDWNVVLFNGMEKTSHWAALYFVALMTFGNYVLFNLLVAILVEGFSAEDDKRESESRSRSCSLCEKQECETSTDKENPEPKWDEEDPKDNIEKEIKMKAYPYVLTVLKEGGATTNLCFPPVITHTAATPQGSPNATLTLQRPEKTLNVSNPSLDKNPTPVSPEVNGVYPVFQVASLNIPSIHLATGGSPQNSRRSSVIVALSRQSSIISNISRKNSLGPCFSLQTKGNFNGWRSHKRKKSENESSENGSGSEDVVLNNMTSHSPSHPSNGDHGHCNGSIPTLQNTPNNKRPIANHNSNSPQNSIKSISLSQYREQQHAPCSRQMSLNSSLHSQNTLSPSNTYCRAASLSGASLKDDFKPNNLDEDKKEDTNQMAVTDCELPNKLLNRYGELQRRTTRFTRSCPHSRGQDEEEEHLLFYWPDSKAWRMFTLCFLKLCWFFEPKGWVKEREDYSLFLFSKSNCLRQVCCRIAENKWFDYTILVFIASNCVTLAMERPTIPPDSYERLFLTGTNYIFIIVFTFEMIVKVMAKGLWYGRNAYFKSGWNIMDGFVVGISLVDVLLSFVAESSPKIFGILRVFRLLRSLRPLR
ncbi:voltage-dependent T-type calcium channel subunit alpha-1I [Trichonephila clavata]|uniref:Voltage-dependent T-type calcium channel subunit alpha-1I n=1 Tax=Trichonephila clavata TaxID=2740835 RepID=A0A8X6GEA3_TRICU|nr:voltage-dependent T-type calcium channel subunit alpha-1I [Trichonephila clavata]